MALYSLSITPPTQFGPLIEIVPGTARVRLLEFGLTSSGSATANWLAQLMRSLTKGIGALTQTAGQAEDPGDPASATNWVQNWTITPTVDTTKVLRSCNGNSASGVRTGVVWTFPRGLLIPSSGSLVLWVAGNNNNATFWLWGTYDE